MRGLHVLAVEPPFLHDLFGSRTALPTRFEPLCQGTTIIIGCATAIMTPSLQPAALSLQPIVPTNSSLAMEVLSPPLPPNETATYPPDIANAEPPAPDPIETYGRPCEPKVTYDLIRNYQATDLAATKMYLPKKTKPIVLSCMGFGIPLFPDVTDQSDNELWTELDHCQQVA
jgi:hypothetical protein